MPAFEQVGAELVVLGLRDFERKMGRASRQVTNFGQDAGGVRGGLARFATGLTNVATVAGGLIAARALVGIANQINEIREQALGAARAFQVLELQFQTFIARELKATDATLAHADALERAIPLVQDLTRWIQGFALAAPVDPKVIASTLAYAQAVGFTTTEAKSLTVSIAEFTAAMGFGSTEIERILINFGQMRQQGKVTSTELRDLARGSLLPTADILNEMGRIMGVATEDMEAFRESAASGAVDVNLFFKAFQNLVERDFAGSLDRFARTWDGVAERAKSFLQVVIGYKVLKPVLDRLAESAADFFDSLVENEEAMITFEIVGRALLDIYGTLTKGFAVLKQELIILKNIFGLGSFSVREFAAALAVAFEEAQRLGQIALATINRFLIRLNENFAGTASDAFEWGANIIFSLAEGIINAAKTVLVSAMNFVAGIFSYWLSGQSPPRIAPGLVEWGVNAMREFLSGFTQADFTVLKDIQKPLRSALGIFADLGAIAKESVGPILADVSKDLAKAIGEFSETGFDDPEIFDVLRDVGGDFGQDLVALLQKELALAAAIKEVQIAQEQLNDALAFEEQATSNVQGLVDEYNELLRAGADPAILDARLKEINAAEDELALSREQRMAAEERVEAAEEAVDPIQEQVKAQQELLNQLIELSRLQVDALTGGAGAGAAAPDLTPLEFEDVEDFGATIEKDIDALFNDLKEQVRARWAEIWQSIIDDPRVQSLITTFETATTEISTSWETMSTAIGGFIDTHIQPKIDDFSTWLEDLRNDSDSWLNEIAGFWENDLLPAMQTWWDWTTMHLLPTLEEFKGLLGDIWQLGVDIALGFGTYLVEELGKLVDRLDGDFDIWEWFRGIISNINTFLAKSVTSLSNMRTEMKKLREMVEEFDWRSLNPFIGRSPSPLERGLVGIGKALDRFDSNSFASPIASTQGVVGSQVMRQANVNMGGVNINNGMDLAAFEAVVRRVVNNAI